MWFCHLIRYRIESWSEQKVVFWISRWFLLVWNGYCIFQYVCSSSSFWKRTIFFSGIGQRRVSYSSAVPIMLNEWYCIWMVLFWTQKIRKKMHEKCAVKWSLSIFPPEKSLLVEVFFQFQTHCSPMHPIHFHLGSFVVVPWICSQSPLYNTVIPTRCLLVVTHSF